MKIKIVVTPTKREAESLLSKEMSLIQSNELIFNSDESAYAGGLLETIYEEAGRDLFKFLQNLDGIEVNTGFGTITV